MAELVANCPRCAATNITFDVTSSVVFRQEHSWLNWFEAFSVCRNCKRGTTFVISQTEYSFKEHSHYMQPHRLENRTLNTYFKVQRFISLIDEVNATAPEHTPPEIAKVFQEAAVCMRVQCWNAAGAMLRLSIDLATKKMLPPTDAAGLNKHIRGKLAPRLAWLIEQRLLPVELKGLSECIREDGNDAAHDGTLEKADAEDLLDFAVALFERIYTEPTRLKLAKERRDERRKPRE